jgi:uncharacterized protein YeaO (DUF488 family)
MEYFFNMNMGRPHSKKLFQKKPSRTLAEGYKHFIVYFALFKAHYFQELHTPDRVQFEMVVPGAPGGN